MNAVTIERWRAAQGAELSFWTGMELHELVRTCADKLEFWSQLDPCQTDDLIIGKDVLEIGCGPLGLSLAAFAGRPGAARSLVKTDPLPPVALGAINPARQAWADTFLRWIAELAAQGRYIQAAGEELEFDACFDTVLTYNVLDHVRAPDAILARAHRALRPGGRLLVGVDCLSWVGRLRFEWITRRRAKGSILVEAHPHTFRPADVVRLIEQAGFDLTASLGVPGGLRRLAGRHARPAFLAVRPG